MQATVEQYTETIEEQRRKRAEMLLADLGFFTLAGLFWLKEGANTFGSGSENDIVLPLNSAPRLAGVFHLEGNETTLSVAPDVTITTRDGTRVHVLSMQSDSTGASDYIFLNSLVMLLLQRGERQAIRLYDKEHPARKNFTGLSWYPIAPAYRIPAEFIAYDPPKVLPIVDATGYAHDVPSVGYVQFEWAGNTVRLDAQARGERLFYNFRDATNGDTTYSAGRFLYSELPQQGRVVLDFNLATNPFCAYTPFATCPLPPSQNRLDFRIEAGERLYNHPPE
jgi:uncharacterized protein